MRCYNGIPKAENCPFSQRIRIVPYPSIPDTFPEIPVHFPNDTIQRPALLSLNLFVRRKRSRRIRVPFPRLDRSILSPGGHEIKRQSSQTRTKRREGGGREGATRELAPSFLRRKKPGLRKSASSNASAYEIPSISIRRIYLIENVGKGREKLCFDRLFNQSAESRIDCATRGGTHFRPFTNWFARQTDRGARRLSPFHDLPFRFDRLSLSRRIFLFLGKGHVAARLIGDIPAGLWLTGENTNLRRAEAESDCRYKRGCHFWQPERIPIEV